LSKEIAQTVGGKRIAWLIAILAAFAVFATLSMQSNEAHADVSSITCVPAAGSTVPVGSTVLCRATSTAAGITAVSWTSSNTGVANVTAGGTTLTTIGNPATTDATFTTTAPGSFQARVQFTDGGGVHPPTQANQTATAFTVVGVTGTATTVAAGQNSTVTFTIPAGLTYCSDVAGTTGDARTGGTTATDFVATGLTVVTNTPTTALDNVDGTHTVVVADDATAGGTVTIFTHLATSTVSTDCGAGTTVTLTAANFAVPELRHISDGPDPAVVTNQ
jgi:hypothetical protein